MMTSDAFIQLVSGLITVFCALITAYVVPYIKSKYSAEQLEMLNYYTTVGVRCAEQIYTPEQWEQKKIYVMNYVREIINSKLSIDLTEEQLSAIIEGVVNEVKHR